MLTASRQQDARLLESLANRRSPQFGLPRGGPFIDREPVEHPRVGVLRIHLATGKHQRARGKIDLVVAHHHENLKARFAIAKQHDGRSRHGRRDRFFHGVSVPLKRTWRCM